MRYVKVEFAKNRTEIQGNKWMRFFPKGFCDWYIEKRNPYICLPETLFDAEGYRLVLPMTVQEAGENADKYQMLTERALQDCEKKEREIGMVLLPQSDVSILSPFPIIKGDILSAFFVMEASRMLLGPKKNLGQAEFLLLDGGRNIDDLLFEVISASVNHFSVLTDRKQEVEQMAEEVYEQYGLPVQVFSERRNPLVREADIVINAREDTENADYFYKKGAIYLDFTRNTLKLKRMQRKRGDMHLADGFLFFYNGKRMSSELLEAYYKTKEEAFYHFNMQKKKICQDIVSKAKLKEIYCMGKPVC